jgi:acid phosphatase class B
MNVSFDFDSTIAKFIIDAEGNKVFIGPDEDAIRLIKMHYAVGDTVHIITSRKEKKEMQLPLRNKKTNKITRPKILDFVLKYRLNNYIESINFTNDQLKGDSAVMFNLKIKLHYDDKEDELMSLPPDVIGIPAWEMKTIKNIDQIKTKFYL